MRVRLGGWVGLGGLWTRCRWSREEQAAHTRSRLCHVCNCAGVHCPHGAARPLPPAAEAMRYLSYALYPLVIGYAVYALVYQVGAALGPCGCWPAGGGAAQARQAAASLNSKLFPWMIKRLLLKQLGSVAPTRCSLSPLPPPLCAQTHKSWYSWLLNSLVGAVYTFGL